METKTYKVFEFDELSADAQKIALDELRDQEDPYWYASVEDQWKEKLTELGYDNPDISFSGFGSQGDGASFTARIDLSVWLLKPTTKITEKDRERFYKMLANIAKSDDCEIEAKVFRIDTRYSHENTCRASVELSGTYTPEGEALANELEKLIEADRLALSKQIYKEFEAEYDYLKSDEVLKDESIPYQHKYLKSGKFAPDIE